MGHIVLIVVGLIMISPFSMTGAVAQTGVQPPQTPVQPVQPQNPQDFPQYIVRPQEDLDPFGLSTLGDSTQFGENEGESTFDKDTKRKSNLEVNKRRERKKTQEQVQKTDGSSNEGDSSTYSPADSGSIPDAEAFSEQPSGFTSSSSSLTQSGGIYKWTDKDGVVHVTNSIGSVPPEYREQAAGEAEKVE